MSVKLEFTRLQSSDVSYMKQDLLKHQAKSRSAETTLHTDSETKVQAATSMKKFKQQKWVENIKRVENNDTMKRLNFHSTPQKRIRRKLP